MIFTLSQLLSHGMSYFPTVWPFFPQFEIFSIVWASVRSHDMSYCPEFGLFSNGLTSFKQSELLSHSPGYIPPSYSLTGSYLLSHGLSYNFPTGKAIFQLSELCHELFPTVWAIFTLFEQWAIQDIFPRSELFSQELGNISTAWAIFHSVFPNGLSRAISPRSELLHSLVWAVFPQSKPFSHDINYFSTVRDVS